MTREQQPHVCQVLGSGSFVAAANEALHAKRGALHFLCQGGGRACFSVVVQLSRVSGSSASKVAEFMHCFALSLAASSGGVVWSAVPRPFAEPNVGLDLGGIDLGNGGGGGGTHPRIAWQGGRSTSAMAHEQKVAPPPHAHTSVRATASGATQPTQCRASTTQNGRDRARNT